MTRGIIKVNNFFTRIRKPRCAAGQILILLPSCLQCSECERKITVDVANCKRCGRCKVRDLLELADKYGCPCAVATGGRLALQRAKSEAVRAIIAVACEKELLAGIVGTFPKPGYAVVNLRPNGPCKDTDVDVVEVEKAVNLLLREDLQQR